MTFFDPVWHDRYKLIEAGNGGFRPYKIPKRLQCGLCESVIAPNDFFYFHKVTQEEYTEILPLSQHSSHGVSYLTQRGCFHVGLFGTWICPRCAFENRVSLERFIYNSPEV